jgi:hypothetical protein
VIYSRTTATNTPEGKAYVRDLLAPRIKAGVEQAMAGQLNGSRPVRLDIVVKSFVIASAVQRILIGGGSRRVRSRDGRKRNRRNGGPGGDR